MSYTTKAVIAVGVLIPCFLGFATAGYLVGLSRIRGIDSRLDNVEAFMKKTEQEDAIKRKLGQVMIQMDEHIGNKCDHSGPHFIAENNEGTYCIDCGAKIKDGRK